MTEDEIRILARQGGIDADRLWRASTNILMVRPYELDFIHVLLQHGEAVAVQKGNYVSFTTGLEFEGIQMLCGAPPLPDRTFWDYERRTGGEQ